MDPPKTVTSSTNNWPRADLSLGLKLKGKCVASYYCFAAAGRLTEAQKTEIARSVSEVHEGATGTEHELVLVFFQELAPGNYYLGGRPAPADQILIRADIREGRTDEQKSEICLQIVQDVSRIAGAPEDAVWVVLDENPVANFAEWGKMLPLPGHEDAWLSTLPEATRNKIAALAS